MFDAFVSIGPSGSRFGPRIVQRIVDGHSREIDGNQNADGVARFAIAGIEPVE